MALFNTNQCTHCNILCIVAIAIDIDSFLFTFSMEIVRKYNCCDASKQIPLLL